MFRKGKIQDHPKSLSMTSISVPVIPNIKTYSGDETDAYGELQFASTQNKAKYVRASKETTMETLEKLLTQKWQLKIPNIIISVTGGAKNFKMQHKLKLEFSKSLIKAAESTGAWIITGGTHTGVMKIVGSAIQSYSTAKSSKVTALGIATWGIVHDQNTLKRTMSAKEKVVKYECKETEKHEKTACLDKNYSHFILVDSGKSDYGGEIDLRSDLERHLDSKQNVKVVCVMVQGGQGSLKTICNAVCRGIPAVVVDGSGQWANILGIICSKSYSGAITESQIFKLLAEQGMDDDKITSDQLSQWTNYAKQCVKFKSRIKIFSLDDPDDIHDLDIAILQAILSVDEQNEDSKSHLELALAWNRPDIAGSEIFTDDISIPSGDMLAMFKTALIEGKDGFIKLFLYHGLKFEKHDHFSDGNLVELYKLMSKDTPFYHMIKDKDGNLDNLDEKGIFLAIKDLLSPKFDVIDFGKSKSSQRTIRNLFVWCILQNKKECARELWEAMLKEELPACVIANRLLMGLAKKETVKEKKDQLQEHALVYQNHSYDILTECYNENPERTTKLLKRRLNKWGDLTCLQVAVDARDYKFVSHPAVQLFLDKVWFGNIFKDEQQSYVWLSLIIFICAFFPFLIPCFVKFQQQTTEDKMRAQENAENGSLPSDESQLLDSATCKKTPGSSLQLFWSNIRSFYQAPVVKFHLTIMSHLMFLALFAYILLFNFFDSISVFEYILLAWVITLVLEEARQVIEFTPRHWFSDFGNKLDVLSFVLYFIGFGLRFRFIDPSRVLLALAFIVFCLRILSTFTVHEKLGPKILMVAKMLEDLFFFLFILLVFLIAYGVARQSLLYPNESNVGTVFTGIFSKPYWNIYGELFLPEIIFNPTDEEFTCTNDTSRIAAGETRCPEQNVAVPIISAVYLLLANVLLLNLLIAMFSYTFDKLVSDTDRIWKYQRFGLIQEYYNRPTFVAPLNPISYIIRIFSSLVKEKKNTAFYHEYEGKTLEQLTTWESSNADEYLAKVRSQTREAVDNKVQSISDRLDALSSTVDAVMHNMKLQKKTNKRVHVLESKLATSNESLQWIISALKDNNYLPKAVLKEVHTKARTSPYYQSTVKRFPLNEHMISWNIPFPDYKPPYHTDKKVLVPPVWADKHLGEGDKPILRSLPFNKFDAGNKVDRTSYTGSYEVVDGLPRNPMGRTGLTGRGLLGRYGPNHAADTIVTRWKKDEHGDKREKNGKPMLEFIAIKREDTKEWAIPGGMVNPGENVNSTRKREFLEEVSTTHTADDAKTKAFEDFFTTKGVEIFNGYCDDHRNTDCAWIETSACNYHDEDDSVFQSVNLKPGDETVGVTWKTVDDSLVLFADHKKYLERVAAMHNAYFKEQVKND